MIPDDPLLGSAGMLCLAFGAALNGGDRERRLSAAGLLVLALALAAWRAGSPAGAPLTPPDRLETGFLMVNGGLLLLGGALVCGASVRAPADTLRLGSRLLTGGGILLLGVPCGDLIGAAAPRAVGAAVMLGVAGAAVALAVRAIAGKGWVRSAARMVAPEPLVPAVSPGSQARTPALVLVAGAAAVGLGPHLAIVFTGVIAAAWAGHLLFLRTGHRPIPVAPVLTLTLVPVYWLLATVAGPLGLSTGDLSQLPLSPAAELLVAPGLLLAGWALAGLWPLQRQLPGALLGPLGALLLVRTALPLVPVGLEHLRPLAVPLVVLGLWNAAAHARWPLTLSGAGFLGVASAAPGAFGASLMLLAAGLALETGRGGPVPRRLASPVRVAAWPVAAWAGGPLLEGSLRGEVVYTTVGVLGMALLVVMGRADAGLDRYSAR